MDGTDKVSAGQRFRPQAKTWNELIDAAKAYTQSHTLEGRDAADLGEQSPVVVQVKNTTETHWPRMSVIGLGDPVPTPAVDLTRFKNEITFLGRVPTASDRGRYVITREPIAPGQVGEAVISGVSVAKLNVVNEGDDFAEMIVDNSESLSTGSAGSAQIIWKPEGTGELWGIVRLTSAVRDLFRIQLTGTLPLGGEATARRLESVAGTYEMVGAEFTVRDFTETPGSWWGVAGYCGWARYMPDSAKAEIVWLETNARFIAFTSTEDMGYTTPGKMAATVTDWWHIKTPGGSIILSDPQGHFKRAKSGSTGLAIYDEKRNLYIIWQCTSKADWIQFKLRAGQTLADGDALADVIDYGGSQQDIRHPDPNGDGISVKDPKGLFKRALELAEGFAKYDSVLDTYDVWECQSKAGWIRGTLNAVFSGGTSAGASVLDHGGTQQDIQNPGSTVTINDPSGKGTRAAIGAKFEAIYDAVDDVYNLLWCEQIGFTATATLGAALSGGATATISGFTITSPAPFNLAPATLPTTVKNRYKHWGLSGKKVELVWDESVTDWQIIDVEKTEAKIPVALGGVGAFRISGGKFQAYMMTTGVEYAATPVWEDINDVTTCT